MAIHPAIPETYAFPDVPFMYQPLAIHAPPDVEQQVSPQTCQPEQGSAEPEHMMGPSAWKPSTLLLTPILPTAGGDAAAPAIGGDAAAPKKIMGPSAWKPLSDYPEPPPLPAKFKELMWQAYSVHPKIDFHAAFI